MEVFLNSAWGPRIFLTAVLLIAGTVSFAAGKLWLAEHWGRSSGKQYRLRAARLEPTNANYWYRLGRFHDLAFEHPDLDQAIFYYERATKNNPRSARNWTALARAYEMKEEQELARTAFEKGRSVYPISPQVAWHYGNFLLRQGQLSEAFVEIRQALAVDRGLTTAAVALCWRASGDAERILDKVLPHEGNVYLQAMQYFLSQQEVDVALTVWKRVLALKQPLEIQHAFPLLEILIGHGRIGQAKEVWQQALKPTGLERHESAMGSLVWNGGFEGALLNGGFGWRQRRIAGAKFEFDTGTYRSGVRSLKVSFDGTANLNFEHLIQSVPVEARSRYHFTAFLRTEGVSTDSGLRFRIFDSHRPAAFDILTPSLVGSEPWSPHEAEFTTGPETRLLVIALRRIPSRKFDNKLQGTVWVDAVALTPVVSSPMRKPP